MIVNIKGFQAIKEADLDFTKGITAIVGQTNSGKSSIIRAIEAAITNKFITNAVNYDMEEATITIENDGNIIIYNKPKNKNKPASYTINGDVLDKVGRTQLDSVGELLKMAEVVINNEKIRLNFWRQLDYPFLVGKPPRQLFDFIAQSKEYDLINTFQDKKQEEKKDRETSLTVNNSTINGLKTSITTLEGEIKELKDKYSNIDIEELKVYNNIYNNLKNLFTIRRDLVDRTDYLKDRYYKVEHNSRTLKDSIDKLQTIYDIYDSLVSKVTRVKDLKEKVDNYKSLKDNKSSLEEKINNLFNGLLEGIEKLSSINTHINNKKSLETNLGRYRQALTTLSTDLKQVEEELKTFTVCPYCESPLNQGVEHTHE